MNKMQIFFGIVLILILTVFLMAVETIRMSALFVLNSVGILVLLLLALTNFNDIKQKLIKIKLALH